MDLTKQMEQVVNGFVAQVTELAKRAAIETLTSTMGFATRGSFPRATTSGGRGKRGAEQIDATKEKLVNFILDNPGKRSEQINAALRTTTKDIALPLRQLVADKLVTTKGQRRGMTYFVNSAKS
ncbi:MAG: putative binding protein [Myxococcales bacterium]|nr:putative binding protein [Myxococcales bacterium]